MSLGAGHVRSLGTSGFLGYSLVFGLSAETTYFDYCE